MSDRCVFKQAYQQPVSGRLGDLKIGFKPSAWEALTRFPMSVLALVMTASVRVIDAPRPS